MHKIKKALYTKIVVSTSKALGCEYLQRQERGGGGVGG